MDMACSTNGIKYKYVPGCVRGNKIGEELLVRRRRWEDNVRKVLN
jgi:hypothetical protein